MSLDSEPRWRLRRRAHIRQEFLAQVGLSVPVAAASQEPKRRPSRRGCCSFDLADLEPDEDTLILTGLPRMQRASIHDLDLTASELDEDDLIVAGLPHARRTYMHDWDDEEINFA